MSSKPDTSPKAPAETQPPMKDPDESKPDTSTKAPTETQSPVKDPHDRLEATIRQVYHERVDADGHYRWPSADPQGDLSKDGMFADDEVDKTNSNGASSGRGRGHGAKNRATGSLDAADTRLMVFKLCKSCNKWKVSEAKDLAKNDAGRGTHQCVDCRRRDGPRKPERVVPLALPLRLMRKENGLWRADY